MGESPSVVVAGAGPAGLTAAYELAKHGVRPVVFEKSDQVGGISRTETYKGYRFDIGGHRFFTKVGEVEALWREILGDDFVQTPRLSRIYYEGKFYPYLIEIWPTLRTSGRGRARGSGSATSAPRSGRGRRPRTSRSG